MAQVVAEVLDRPVAYQQLSPEAYLDTMVGYGMTHPWAHGLLDMTAAQDDGIYDTEKTTATPSPTSFRT